jgi:hypothetical protein
MSFAVTRLVRQMPMPRTMKQRPQIKLVLLSIAPSKQLTRVPRVAPAVYPTSPRVFSPADQACNETGPVARKGATGLGQVNGAIDLHVHETRTVPCPS